MSILLIWKLECWLGKLASIRQVSPLTGASSGELNSRSCASLEMKDYSWMEDADSEIGRAHV